MSARINNSFDPTQTARRRLAKETGVVFKEWSEGDGRLTIALVYPNRYEIGMSNLGFQQVYRMLNDREDVICERAFLPSDDERQWLKENRRVLRTMESDTPVGDFDILAFSVTFEQDYLHILALLDLAGVARHDRGEHDPFVLGGGVALTMNPEVMAPFFDAIVIGEAESVLDKFIDTYHKTGGELPPLAAVSGVYVPAGYEPVYEDDNTLWRFMVSEGYPELVTRQWNIDMIENPNTATIETPDTVFGDMALVEVGKGCGQHCRFCAAGYIYRPTRHADTFGLLAKIDEALERKGKVGLIGSALGDHPEAEWIFEHIANRQGKFSVSSLRLDKITEKMIDAFIIGECKTLTFAPEAGSERLRMAINKPMTDARIIHQIRVLAASHPFSLKFYFLIGLPGETRDDVTAIVDLVKEIQSAMVEESRRRGTLGSITVSVNPFVPKPMTPYQWFGYIGIKEAQKRLNMVRDGLKITPNVTIQTSSAREAYVQAMLSVGDRRVAAILERAYALEGDWKRAMNEMKAEEEIDADFFALRQKRSGETLPWGIIDHGMHSGYLQAERRKGSDSRITEPCPPPGEDCKRCGTFIGVCQES
jgi:radical SAM superfamily enzyme YgiQ (UPF0313 family)